MGLGNAKDAKWRSGEHMVGVWFEDQKGAAEHQAAMHCVEDGQYAALAVAPIASGRLDPPDIVLFYATPGAMMYFINGQQWSGYKRFDWSVVGETHWLVCLYKTLIKMWAQNAGFEKHDALNVWK